MLASVDIVVLDIPESVTMVAMINKQLGEFLVYYLTEEVKMEKKFKIELLKASIDPELLHEIRNCTWESKTKNLTTTEDLEDKKDIACKDAAWYTDEFAEFDQGKAKGTK